MIRVMITDDSVMVREILKDLIASVPDMQLVGEARNGREAIEQVRALRPDVLVLDIVMPVMDGIEALKAIMAEAPLPVVMFTTLDSNSISAFKAIKAGALEVLEKPQAMVGEGAGGAAARFLLERIRAVAGVEVRAPGEPKARAAAPLPGPAGAVPGVVAIGASSGGPAAISLLLKSLPENLPFPILLVQQLAPGFETYFSQWLGRETSLEVRIPQSGETLSPGTLYLAPGDRHLAVGADGALRLHQEAQVNERRPSADVLFDSVAARFGGRATAVLLSGTGTDGVAGLGRVRAAGGRTLVQDRETALAFETPGAAIQAGHADEVLPVYHLAGAIVRGAAAKATG